jgi:hypothetical protein
MRALAALPGLHRRAREGGSWVGRTSLSQYDIFLLRLGLYGEGVKTKMRQEHKDEFFKLRHADSVDEGGKRALKSMKILYLKLFDDSLMRKPFGKGFGEEIKWCRSQMTVEGLRVGVLRASRPNGYDEASWEGRKVEKAIVEG